MIAATRPWWPHLFSFPRFLDVLSWFWLSVKGYAFTSSGLQLSIPAGVLMYWRRHNCHHAWCPFLSWHPHPDHGHLVCKFHHPHDPKDLASCSTASSPTSANN